MKIKYYFYSITDGIVRSLLFLAMNNLFFSVYSFSINQYILIGCAFSIAAVIVSIPFFCRVRSNIALLIMYVISFLFFWITNILNWFVLRISFFPERPVSPAEGFIALFLDAIFTAFMITRFALIALRFALNCIKKKRATGSTGGQGDGSKPLKK